MQRPGSLQYNSQRINPGVVVVRELTKDRPSLLRVQTAVERASRLQHVQFFCFGRQKFSALITVPSHSILGITLLRPIKHAPRLQPIQFFSFGKQRLSTPIKLSLLFPLLQLQRPFEHTPRQQLVRSLYVGQQ
jgi:hypothetical protein